MLITEYPKWVAAEGITVKVMPGFATRSHGEFRVPAPACVWHHDASPPGDSPGVLDWMLSNWDEASANVWINRAGVWHFVGAGVAWHAGKVLPGMPGNYDAFGIETDHTVGETMAPRLYDSLRRGTAAIMRRQKQKAANALHFHKTICSPVGRKSDPWGLDLATERRAVQTIIDGGVDPLDPINTTQPGGPGGADPRDDWDDMDEAQENRLAQKTANATAAALAPLLEKGFARVADGLADVARVDTITADRLRVLVEKAGN